MQLSRNGFVCFLVVGDFNLSAKQIDMRKKDLLSRVQLVKGLRFFNDSFSKNWDFDSRLASMVMRSFLTTSFDGISASLIEQSMMGFLDDSLPFIRGYALFARFSCCFCICFTPLNPHQCPCSQYWCQRIPVFVQDLLLLYVRKVSFLDGDNHLLDMQLRSVLCLPFFVILFCFRWSFFCPFCLWNLWVKALFGCCTMLYFLLGLWYDINRV